MHRMEIRKTKREYLLRIYFCSVHSNAMPCRFEYKASQVRALWLYLYERKSLFILPTQCLSTLYFTLCSVSMRLVIEHSMKHWTEILETTDESFKNVKMNASSYTRSHNAQHTYDSELNYRIPCKQTLKMSFKFYL